MEETKNELKKEEPIIEELTPEKIFETCFAFAHSRVLVSGVDLDLFTHIFNGNKTSKEIADAAQTDPRGTEILLNSLVALKFLTKSEGIYGLTPISEKFLVKSKPTYYGDFVPNVDMLWEPWRDLTKIVKTGKPFSSIEREEGEKFFEKLVSQLFPMSYSGACATAEILGVGKTLKNLNILDVAAGSGAWSIAFAERDKGTHVVAQDWPNVIEVTKKFVNKFGLDERYSYISGDLRKVEFGHEKYDLVILGHICHSEGPEHTAKLISRTYDSLKDGGKLLIADIVPDDERSSEVFPLLFAVNMLINTTEGNTFTMKEYKEWLQSTGFNDINTLKVPGPSPLIIAIK